MTPNAISDPQAFRAELAKIRELGYAVSLGERDASWSIVQATVTGSIGVIALSVAFEGFYHTPLSVLERLWLLAAALLLVVPGTATDLMGLGLVAAFYVLQRRREVERARLQTVA